MKIILTVISLFISTLSIAQDDIVKLVEHYYARNEDVKIHYVAAGEGPLILFVHGFPDFWYTWRDQMLAFSDNYTVAAVDMRGYNLSDKPKGVENYTYEKLVDDLVAVINHTKKENAIVIAHDWGAAISWRLALEHPELVKKYIALSVSHPNAGKRALDSKSSNYAEKFVTDEFTSQFNKYWFAGWVTDKQAKLFYFEAFKQSDKEAMFNYYRANYPLKQNLNDEDFNKRINKDYDNATMPVMVVHGKNDAYIPISSHYDLWNYVDNDLTIEIISTAGHFIQQDESERLTNLIKKFIEY